MNTGFERMPEATTETNGRLPVKYIYQPSSRVENSPVKNMQITNTSSENKTAKVPAKSTRLSITLLNIHLKNEETEIQPSKNAKKDDDNSMIAQLVNNYINDGMPIAAPTKDKQSTRRINPTPKTKLYPRSSSAPTPSHQFFNKKVRPKKLLSDQDLNATRCVIL